MISLLWSLFSALARLIFGGGYYVIHERKTIETEMVGCRFDLYDSSGDLVAKCDLNGTLTLFPGYYWDGASGPTWDTESTREASAAHDAFYEAIRNGQILPHNRKGADDLLRRLMIKDGSFRFRAWYYWLAVRLFGRLAIGEIRR